MTQSEARPTSSWRPDAHGLDAAGLQILDREACLAVLARGGVGRIAINVGALPLILPVRFALDGERVVVRVRQGSTLERATQDTVVAFEADDLGPAEGWSISFVGLARHLPDSGDVGPGVRLALPHWGGDGEHLLVGISTEHVSGRRIDPSDRTAEAGPPSTSET